MKRKSCRSKNYEQSNALDIEYLHDHFEDFGDLAMKKDKPMELMLEMWVPSWEDLLLPQ